MNQPNQGNGVPQDHILKQYWRENLVIITIHLVIWALVSYVFGIILVEPLNKFHLAGFPVGFWFANQGSEIIFVIMIFVYCAFLNRLDRKFDVHE